MKRIIILIWLIGIGAGQACADSLLSASSPEVHNIETERKQMDMNIKDYILRHPEIIRDALNELDRREREAQETLQRNVITKEKANLLSKEGSLMLGTPIATSHIVEFFDYNCPYCKKSDKILTDLVNESRDVKAILRLYPIFGRDSIQTSKIVLAAARQTDGKRLAEYHAKLMEYNGRMNGDIAIEIAKKLNFDINKIKIDAEDQSIVRSIEENMRLGSEIGVDGTPTFVIGDKIIVGAVESSEIRRHLEGVRK